MSSRLQFLSRTLTNKNFSEKQSHEARMSLRESRLDALLETGSQVSLYPLPPLAKWEGLFPTFQEMMECKTGINSNVFSYNIVGGSRRMTIISDAKLAKAIYFPDNVRVKHNAAVLAYHWFGIPKEMSRKYTDEGLRATVISSILLTYRRLL